ncbi:hypothetical protein HHK36_008502 [Tetracentron sinense]|uniref:Uncharacterized protein n=1 Tax=Tetracentron sinense TaxID=13715 RepID=A0A834ZFN1_TETSI|nr:hypothetical protein HHK36_008502 [Tetracentron sinense]
MGKTGRSRGMVTKTRSNLVESFTSPKGDISYLQKFFLMYVGRRLPLHLQEDFFGTAFLRVVQSTYLMDLPTWVISNPSVFDTTEWLRSDPRRIAVGVDLELEALTCYRTDVKDVKLFPANNDHPSHDVALGQINA